MKDYNLNRHYDKLHKDAYDKYTGPARDALVTELKGRSIAHMNGFQANCPLSALRVTRLRFPSCQGVLKDVPERGKHFSKYRKDLETLQQQFTTRFQDLVALQPRLALSTDPLAAVPSEQPPDLQIELCALQSDPSFQAKRNEPAISFWKLVPRDQVSGILPFPWQACLEAHIYVRRLFHYETHQEKSDDNLFHLMQIALTNIEIDIPRIVCNSRSHSWLI